LLFGILLCGVIIYYPISYRSKETPKETRVNRQLKTMVYASVISVVDLFVEGSYIILGIIGVILLYVNIQKQKREFVNTNPINNN